MYGFLIVIHVIASLILITSILLQAGQGGGLSEAFGGGGLDQKIFGTQTTTFLARLTTAAAVMFIFTSLSLAVISGKRGKSLIEMEEVQDELTPQERIIPPEVEVEVIGEEPVPVSEQ